MKALLIKTGKEEKLLLLAVKQLRSNIDSYSVISNSESETDNQNDSHRILGVMYERIIRAQMIEKGQVAALNYLDVQYKKVENEIQFMNTSGYEQSDIEDKKNEMYKISMAIDVIHSLSKQETY